MIKTFYCYIVGCLLFFLFGFYGSTPLIAQAIQPAFLNYTTDDGLPSSETYDILQDRNGYIWIASDNGVSRFDGTNFKNYGTEEGLLDKTILFMHEDHRGWIWMSTLSGNFYIHRGDTIVPYEYNSIFQEDREKYQVVHDFIVDRAGVLHASLMSDKIIAITPNGDTTIWQPKLTLPSEFGIYETGGKILQLTRTSVNVPGINAIALRFLSTDDRSKVEEIILPTHLLNRVSGKMPLFVFQLKEDYFFQLGAKLYFCGPDLVIKRSVGFPYGTINCLLQSSRGQIFTGLFENRGLRIYADYSAFQQGQVQQTLFDDLTIAHLTEDANGGIWIATQEQGVYYIPSLDAKRVIMDIGADKYTAIATAYPSAVELYATTLNGRVFLFNEKDLQRELPSIKGIFSTLLFHFDQRTQNLIKSSPLAILDNNEWNFYFRNTYETVDTSMIIHDFIYGLRSETHYGYAAANIWNFYYDEERKGYITNFIRAIPRLSRITCISGRTLDQLWIGSSSGLYHYAVNTNELNPVRDSLLAKEQINCLKILPDESILIGTKRNGLFHYKNGQFINPSLNQQLAAYPVNKIEVDHNGQIWIINRQGIHKLTYQDTLQYKFLLSKTNGLPSNEIIDIAFVKDELWTIDKNGISIFPLAVDQQDFSLAVLIENIYIAEQEASVEACLSVPYDNNINIKFTALNFASYQPTRYRYRLAAEDNWVETTENTINLIDLSPNNYTLEIQAFQNNQQWCTSTTLPIVVAPPFWQTSFFIVFCFLVVLLIIYWLFKRQLTLLAKEQERLKLQEQVTQLKQKAYRAQMNPHFIFNCMSTIQGMIIGEKEERDKAIKMLANFSQLIRSALEFSEVELLSLQEEVTLLNNYLSLEQIRFNHNFSYTINIQEELESDWIQLPPMLVQPFVENAVLHGMEGKNGDGRITLNYQLIEDVLQVTISDNGPGISYTKALKLERQSRFAHKSLGMTITQRRLEILNDSNYKISIEEPLAADGSIRGTTVTIHIPVKY